MSICIRRYSGIILRIDHDRWILYRGPVPASPCPTVCVHGYTTMARAQDVDWVWCRGGAVAPGESCKRGSWRYCGDGVVFICEPAVTIIWTMVLALLVAARRSGGRGFFERNKTHQNCKCHRSEFRTRDRSLAHTGRRFQPGRTSVKPWYCLAAM